MVKSPTVKLLAPDACATLSHKCATIFVSAAISMLAASCSSEPRALQGIVRDSPLHVEEVSLPDVSNTGDGETPFTMRAATGELLFVYFGYTSCPDLCPTTLATWKAALRQVGDDAARVDTVFVTVDAARDTAEILNGYVGSFVDRYHVLRTTDPAELQSALDAFLAAATIETAADGKVEVSHTTVAYMVDDRGDVIVEWPLGTNADAMSGDLKILLEDVRQRI